MVQHSASHTSSDPVGTMRQVPRPIPRNHRRNARSAGLARGQSRSLPNVYETVAARSLGNGFKKVSLPPELSVAFAPPCSRTFVTALRFTRVGTRSSVRVAVCTYSGCTLTPTIRIAARNSATRTQNLHRGAARCGCKPPAPPLGRLSAKVSSRLRPGRTPPPIKPPNRRWKPRDFQKLQGEPNPFAVHIS
jgi:hypothetical protein